MQRVVKECLVRLLNTLENILETGRVLRAASELALGAGRSDCGGAVGRYGDYAGVIGISRAAPGCCCALSFPLSLLLRLQSKHRATICDNTNPAPGTGGAPLLGVGSRLAELS